MAKRRGFEKDLIDFIETYETSKKIDEKLKNKILEKSTAWNKESVMIELIKRIDEYREYEDFSDEKSDFPYRIYLSKFMQEMPKNIVEEVDLS